MNFIFQRAFYCHVYRFYFLSNYDGKRKSVYNISVREQM